MVVKTSIKNLVQQLGSAGVRPPEQLVERILEKDADQVRLALLDLATAVGMLDDDEPVCWGPVHALRLLGEMPDVGIIVPLITCSENPPYYTDDDPAIIWISEVMQMIGRCGAAAVPVLWSLADDEQHHPQDRFLACQSLPFVAVVDPEVRADLIAETRRRLEHAQQDKSITNLITILAYLGTQEAYADVMAAYRAGQVNTNILPATTARQMLLGGGHYLLKNTTMSFWERYDTTGPFAEI